MQIKGTQEAITLFEVKVYATKLKGIDHEKIKKQLKKLKQIQRNPIEASNEGGWHSEIFWNPPPTYLEALNKKIVKFVQETARKDFEIRGDTPIHNSWFICNKKGDFNKPHKHPPYTLSGAYYIQAPKNSGDIVFKNDMEMNNYATTYWNYNTVNSKEFTVVPEEGLLLIFPAWLEHYVNVNKSSQERIVYSFNI